MTSVASFNAPISFQDIRDASTAGNFTLVFSGVRIPSSAWIPGVNGWVESFQTNPVRFEQIARRQCFTSTMVFLDGRYPAFSWEHDFLVYTETGSLGQFAEAFFKLVDEVREFPVPLRLEDGDTGNAVIEYGDCFIEGPDLDNPSELLLFRAGFLRVRFVGNTRPIVNDLP